MVGDKRGGSMAEAAIALPVILLVLFFGWNLAHVAFTAMAARQAADYGARVASVNNQFDESWIRQAVKASLTQSGAQGTFSEPLVEYIPGGENMTMVRVTIEWHHGSILRNVCSLLGKDCPREFFGTVTAVRMQERWRP